MFSWFPTLWKYTKYNHLLASFPLKWSRRAICQNWEGAHLSERHGLHSIYVNSFTASVLFSMCKVFNSQWKYIGWKKLGNMLPITKEQTRYFSISNLFPIPRRNSSLWPQNLNTLKKINITQYYYRNTCQLIVIRHTLRAIIQLEVDLLI